MILLFAQVADTAHKLIDSLSRTGQQLAPIPEKELRFGDLLIKGGWIMVPIGVLAVLGLVIFFERYFTIRKASKSDGELMERVRTSVLNGNIDAAMNTCRKSGTALGRMILKGLSRIGRPIKDIERAIESIGKLEVSKLEKNTGILVIVAGIAPMFGFLGTIIGVIKIFYDISASGNLSISVISGGLYVKMITSAAGLMIGILAYVAYHILNMMVEKLILRLETDAIEFIDLLEEPSK